MKDFFDSLLRHPQEQIRSLADVIADAGTLKDTRRLYTLVDGSISESKKIILNTELVIFGKTRVKKKYDGIDLATLSVEERARVSIIVSFSM